ncbi:nickel-dependent lactate racemase [Spirochaeta isovalerica]|uniref:Nickel-dependent lactate racemase n=1 Tax=Spirochaeta isovalerica TaxID=150 RepID=A0A841R876_9SPIO|nr:nickel-dependent lactate racemase [Spirochaeta isovalerica]MBB6480085.1 nickel-dependent lactate racemase [Spirochaeta isovalerica]
MIHTKDLKLPEGTDILTMPHPESAVNPRQMVADALENPIGSPQLEQIIASKSGRAEELTACIVISDSTRPVPYKGEAGILYPLVEKLMNSGVPASGILVLVATGTHRGQTDSELRDMLDPRLFELPVRVENHDCHNEENLSFLGKTGRGSDILINSDYVNSDIKILTGLVESHFMAGASGGRKSICPGLIGEKSTFIFHGAPMLADERSCALNLEGNLCHDEALDMARVAGADFIVNVTLDGNFDLTGVFAGHLEKAHEAAVAHLKSYTAIHVERKYDIVLTHGGFVGINHYQAAKAGVEAARIVKEGGYVLMVADNTDTDPIGSLAYRTMLQLLKLTGREAFDRTILSPDWTFIPEQWQVQMWNRMFKVIPQDHFYYMSPQFSDSEYRICPGEKLSDLSGLQNGTPAEHLSAAVANLKEKLGDEISICWMADGPYGVPLYE